MDDLALNTFLLGLSSPIATILRCRNPATFNEAVQHAIAEEKLYNLTKTSSSLKPSKQCAICSKFGHTTSECFKNKRNANSSQQRAFNVNPDPNISIPPGPKQCRYCKNLGHTIDECRKLKYNNSRRNNFLQGPAPRTNPLNNAVANNIIDEQTDESLNQEWFRISACRNRVLKTALKPLSQFHRLDYILKY